MKRPVEAGPVLAYLQDCRRAHRRKSRWDRFTDAYTVFLFAALGAYLAFAALRESAISPAEAAPVIDELARWAPPVLLLLLIASLRYCTWQGPVLFSLPDVEWLLSAPLSHVEIVRRRLRRGLVIAAGLGAALGLATFVVVEAELGVPAWPLFGATLGGLVTLGLLAGAAGWLIECSPKRARIVLRASPLVVPVAAALAFAPSVADGDVVLWSGPWGWAAAPIIATAGALRRAGLTRRSFLQRLPRRASRSPGGARAARQPKSSPAGPGSAPDWSPLCTSSTFEAPHSWSVGLARACSACAGSGCDGRVQTSLPFPGGTR